MQARASLLSGIVPALCLLNSLAGIAGQTEFSKYLASFTGTVHGCSDFDMRRQYIENAINDRLAQKIITADQANTLLENLAAASKATTEICAASKKSLSFTQALNATTRLNAVYADVARTRTAGVAQPGAVTLRKELQERLESAISSGSISRLDAEECNHELKHIIDIETTFLNANEGKLSSKQENILQGDLEKVSNHLDQQMRLATTLTGEFNERRLALENKLAGALAKHIVSAKQSDLIRTELLHLAAMLQAHVESNGAPSESCAIDLAKEIDKLDELIETSSKERKAPLITVASSESAPQDLNALQDECTTRKRLLRLQIDASTKSGALTPDRAADFVRELDLIDALESAYSKLSGGINQEQNMKISDQLSVIEKQVHTDATATVQMPATKTDAKTQNKRKASRTPGPSLEDRLFSAGNRIREAAKQGKLTSLETKLLGREYDRLIRLYSTSKSSAGPQLAADAAKIANEMDKLDKLISAEINSRGSVTGSYR